MIEREDLEEIPEERERRRWRERMAREFGRAPKRPGLPVWHQPVILPILAERAGWTS